MKIKVFNPLSEKLGFKEKEVHLVAPIKVKDIEVLSEVRLEDYLISKNKREIITSEAEVSEQDEIWILPIVDGG
jgi:molybdopterin converting factor small subunit